MSDYSCLSYRYGDSAWSLDEVGLDREAATAVLVMRAMRWCEHLAVDMLAEILAGHHDPEKPWHMDETFDPSLGCLLSESWWVIIPEGSDYPPLP